MTEIKLMQLLSKVEKNEIEIYDVIKLKDFTDEEIDLILQTKHKKEIMKLIINTDFRNQPLETQKKIIDIIDNSNSTEDSLYYATEIAINKSIINSGYIEEIIETMINLRDLDKIYRIGRIVKNPIAITNKDLMKIIKLIANSTQSENILSFVEYIVTDNITNMYCDVLEKVELILNCQTEEEAREIFNDELEKSLKKNILNLLDDGKIDEINFWQLLEDDYEIASKLLVYSTIPKSLLEKIDGLEIGDYEELIDKYYLENIDGLTERKKMLKEQLSPNIKVRRKTKDKKESKKN